MSLTWPTPRDTHPHGDARTHGFCQSVSSVHPSLLKSKFVHRPTAVKCQSIHGPLLVTSSYPTGGLPYQTAKYAIFTASLPHPTINLPHPIASLPHPTASPKHLTTSLSHHTSSAPHSTASVTSLRPSDTYVSQCATSNTKQATSLPAAAHSEGTHTTPLTTSNIISFKNEAIFFFPSKKQVIQTSPHTDLL